MIQSAMIIVDVRQIIQMIHDSVSAAKTLTARQRRVAGTAQHKVDEGAHEIPFPAIQLKC